MPTAAAFTKRGQRRCCKAIAAAPPGALPVLPYSMLYGRCLLLLLLPHLLPPPPVRAQLRVLPAQPPLHRPRQPHRPRHHGQAQQHLQRQRTARQQRGVLGAQAALEGDGGDGGGGGGWVGTAAGSGIELQLQLLLLHGGDGGSHKVRQQEYRGRLRKGVNWRARKKHLDGAERFARSPVLMLPA